MSFLPDMNAMHSALCASSYSLDARRAEWNQDPHIQMGMESQRFGTDP
jgi:hypothetical protein